MEVFYTIVQLQGATDMSPKPNNPELSYLVVNPCTNLVQTLMNPNMSMATGS